MWGCGGGGGRGPGQGKVSGGRPKEEGTQGGRGGGSSSPCSTAPLCTLRQLGWGTASLCAPPSSQRHDSICPLPPPCIAAEVPPPTHPPTLCQLGEALLQQQRETPLGRPRSGGWQSGSRSRLQSTHTHTHTHTTHTHTRQGPVGRLPAACSRAWCCWVAAVCCKRRPPRPPHPSPLHLHACV